MRGVVYLLIMMLLLGGCRPGKNLQEKVRIVTDSTWTNVRTLQRDTVITIPGDTTIIRVPITKITEVPITKTNGRSSASLKRVGDDIEVECECKSYKQKIEYQEKIIENYQKIQELQQDLITKREKFVPWYIQVLAITGVIALVGILGFLAAKFLKPF